MQIAPVQFTRAGPGPLSDFVMAAAVSELEPHGQFTKWIADHDILIYRHEGEIKAISNICRHFGGPVGFHKMKDGVFTCLWHNYEFSARDGSCITNPQLGLRQYALKVEDGRIWVKLVESAQSPVEGS